MAISRTFNSLKYSLHDKIKKYTFLTNIALSILCKLATRASSAIPLLGRIHEENPRFGSWNLRPNFEINASTTTVSPAKWSTSAIVQRFGKPATGSHFANSTVIHPLRLGNQRNGLCLFKDSIESAQFLILQPWIWSKLASKVLYGGPDSRRM